jgi:hypothetical protein
MICFKLTSQETARIQRAAGFAGFPWQPICARPKTARRFLRRVEAEMRRQGIATTRPQKARWSERPGSNELLSLRAAKSGGLLQNFEITELRGSAS